MFSNGNPKKNTTGVGTDGQKLTSITTHTSLSLFHILEGWLMTNGNLWIWT